MNYKAFDTGFFEKCAKFGLPYSTASSLYKQAGEALLEKGLHGAHRAQSTAHSLEAASKLPRLAKVAPELVGDLPETAKLISGLPRLPGVSRLATGAEKLMPIAEKAVSLPAAGALTLASAGMENQPLTRKPTGSLGIKTDPRTHYGLGALEQYRTGKNPYTEEVQREVGNQGLNLGSFFNALGTPLGSSHLIGQHLTDPSVIDRLTTPDVLLRKEERRRFGRPIKGWQLPPGYNQQMTQEQRAREAAAYGQTAAQVLRGRQQLAAARQHEKQYARTGGRFPQPAAAVQPTRPRVATNSIPYKLSPVPSEFR